MTPKTLPWSLEAEAAVIGSAFLDNRGDSIEKASAILTPDDFYRDAHRLIWQEIISLHDQKKPVDVVTLKDALEAAGILTSVGGVSYLMQFGEGNFWVPRVAHYAEIVRDCSLRRALITASDSIAARAYAGEDAKVLLSDHEATILALRSRNEGAGTWIPASVSAKEMYEQLDERHQTQGQMRGIATGWRDIDSITLGLRPGCLYILAARPGMGKTLIGVQLCVSAALRSNAITAITSLEMDRVLLMNRIACSECMIDSQRFEAGMVTSAEFQRVGAVVERLWKTQLFIDDQTGQTADDIRTRARRLKTEVGLDLLLVDYLQLVAVKGRKSDSRSQDVTEICKSLKNTARELKIPIVALAQVSRETDKRPDKRPILSDLAESAGIEANADLVGFLYRADYYDQNATSEDTQLAEIIIAKHRNGPRGTARLEFYPWCGQFRDQRFYPGSQKGF